MSLSLALFGIHGTLLSFLTGLTERIVFELKQVKILRTAAIVTVLSKALYCCR